MLITARSAGASLCAALLAGCVFRPVEPVDRPPAPVEPVLDSRLPLPPEPILESLPSRRLAPQPPVAPPPGRVIVLVPPPVEAFKSVVTDLEVELTSRQFEIVVLSTADRPALAEVPPAGTDEDRRMYVIAVGMEAARIGAEDLRLPTVFCYVPDPQLATADDVYGVSTVPPLDLQLRAWRQLDPSLASVGLVLGRDEHLLAVQAHQAADSVGISLELRFASSDQEALYLFRRMPPQIDGLWLLPDNAILSPRALREMLAHARSRRIQSLVFTPALLPWGALLSVTGTSANIARTLANVVEGLARGGVSQPVTPLSELEAQVNRQAAEELGLDPPADAWIVRRERER